jgi:peptide deformylase
MIKEIIKDENILTKKSERFIIGQDDSIITDMIDTAEANKEDCCGLAAVQIGEHKRVILVLHNGKFLPFINPAIIQKSKETYTAKEMCLSLDGAREVKRHKGIKVVYQMRNGKSKCMAFSGRTAQIIQHECDHLDGVLI